MFGIFSLLKLSSCRPSRDEEELDQLLRRVLKDKDKPKDKKNPLEEDLDPESSFENDAERQTVDTKQGKFKPKNMHPKKKKALLSQRLDSHPKKAKIGRPPPGSGSGKELSKRNFENDGSLWPNGIVPYVIMYSSFSTTDQTKVVNLVQEAANIIQSHSCVTWKVRDSEQYYVRIQNGGGCSSYIGNVQFSNGYQPLTLSSNGCLYLDVVIHEMLHAMGGRHEQSRMDRPHYMEIMWNKIIDGYANNFDVADTKDDAPYDLSSVMQYDLSAFGNSGDTMKMADPDLEYLITNGNKGLTIYDIAEINKAYQCTDGCSITCNNGGVVQKSGGSACSCECPTGLKGSTCSQLDTSAGCGGVINLAAGQSSPISLQNYNTGLQCTWLVKGAAGTRIKATINSMDLPYSSQFNCYHWIEFRDNLIGQAGKEKCGNVGGSQFVKSIDGNPSTMMIRFDSQKHSSMTPGEGFSLTVEAYTSGCIDYPCKNGGTCAETVNGGFVCTCTNGWSGSTCEHISADAINSCSLSDDMFSCAFKQDTVMSDFKWTITAEYKGNYGLDPALVLRPMTSGTYYYAWQSFLVTTADFEPNDRCLSFKYIFPTNDLTASWPSSVHVYTQGDGLAQVQVAELTTQSATDVWQTKEVQISSVNNLKLTIKGVIGRQRVALDDIKIKPGSCENVLPCVDSNPCQNGGTCVPVGTTATCECNTCMYTGTFCETAVGHVCTFESSSCFLVDSANDDFDWTRRQYNTPSRGTGPDSAYEGQYFLYTEGSSPRTQGDKAILESNVVFEARTYCLKMQYHMRDDQFNSMGSLYVKTKQGSNPADTRFQLSGDQGTNWKSMQLNLSLNSQTKIIIESVRGAGWSSDIAIDDVRLSACSC